MYGYRQLEHPEREKVREREREKEREREIERENNLNISNQWGIFGKFILSIEEQRPKSYILSNCRKCYTQSF